MLYMDDYLKELEEEFNRAGKPITREDVFNAWKNGFALGIACYNDATKNAIQTALVENDIRKYDPLYDDFISSFEVAMGEVTSKYAGYDEIFKK